MPKLARVAAAHAAKALLAATKASIQIRAGAREIGEALDARRSAAFLLHGVTGSGKTEVYLRSIRRAVAAGRQAIVLVPEIALTPQTVARFRGWFERVAVLHSALTDAERRRQWKEIRAGRADTGLRPSRGSRLRGGLGFAHRRRLPEGAGVAGPVIDLDGR